MPKFSRREILRLTGLSALGAFILQACGYPQTELQIQSPVKMPEDLVTGRDNWYATVCRECPAGCGTIVRVVEGRAIKVEGNPFHPLNRGKLCARGQAAVQALYHPDRLKKPLRRQGERGSGQFVEIGWEEALGEVTQRLSQLRQGGEADTVLLITPPLRGHLARASQHFVQSYGSQHMAYEPQEGTVLRAAVKQALGTETLPHFDIASSGYILSFGADFLSTGLSPVAYGLAYGEFRQGARKRGTLVQIESRFSLTAANADEWIPITPGTEGLLALSLAQVMVAEGLADPQADVSALTQGQGERFLAEFQPQRVSQATGIPENRIRELARDFARPPDGGPSLALAGGAAAAHSNGVFNLISVFSLNYLVGSVGKAGGILFNPEPPLPGLAARVTASSFVEWQRLGERIVSGRGKPVKAILTYGANPVYGLPQAADFPRSLRQVPFIVAFASFLDETAAQADIILPVHVPLEDWGNDVPEPGPGLQAVSYQQPAVNPVGESRGFVEVLLSIGKALGSDMAQALPWATALEWLQKDSPLHELNRGSVTAPDFPTFWNKMLQRGGWWDEAARGLAPKGPLAPLPGAVTATFAGSQEDFPFHLIPFSSLSLGEGGSAHLPWLQATPDPLTTVVWQTWVEIGPETARRLSLAEGDVAEVSSVYGKLEAPVYIHPLMPPGVVSLPLGQGHQFYTRYAQGKGANIASLLAPVTERETGALAWAATRVNLKRTGKVAPLAKFEGVVPAFPLPDARIVQVTSAPASGAGAKLEVAGHDSYKWFMAVDLDRCTGCQACVVACQAENNLPLNQEDWFRQRRAFEWIRIERYWDLPAGRARFIPVLCQHCENAPCEPVCPVYATSHNDQGLNIQVYPRCIGTRFCANNCPYQVRFFNFWPARWPQSLRNQLNPDVTVRPRGVIEKCTFCVQRINRGIRRAKAQGRPLQDGEIIPACAQACPTNALVFGNILDAQSRVSRLARDPRGYRLLEEMGTEPNVVYLKIVAPHASVPS